MRHSIKPPLLSITFMYVRTYVGMLVSEQCISMPAVYGPPSEMAVENLAGPSAPFPFASSLVSCASSSRCGDGKARRREDKRSLETDVSTLLLYRTKSKQEELYCRVSASQAWVKNTSCLFLRHRLQTSRNPPYCLLATTRGVGDCETWMSRWLPYRSQAEL